MMMAAIDGIENKIHPGDPLDKDIYKLSPDEYEKIGSAPGVAGRSPATSWRTTTSSCSRATSSPPT